MSYPRHQRIHCLATCHHGRVRHFAWAHLSVILCAPLSAARIVLRNSWRWLALPCRHSCYYEHRSQVVCDDCQSLCSLCNMVLCRECEEVCNKCGDVFCADRENFVVKCEVSYCRLFSERERGQGCKWQSGIGDSAVPPLPVRVMSLSE